MRHLIIGGATIALFSQFAYGGGIQRTDRSAMVLFEEGNYAEISYTYVRPGLVGQGSLSGASTGDATENFSLPAGALKMDLTDRLAAAITVRKPYGIDLAYAETMPEFGGTRASADSLSITGLLGYQLPYGVTLFGGVRQQRINGADVDLAGLGYGPASGYSADFDDDWGTGYVAGGAYELPDIGLRLAVTYNSEIKHSLATRETLDTTIPVPGVGPVPVSFDENSDTPTRTPESWVFEAQTGITQNTLAFGSVRHVKHADFTLTPQVFEQLTDRGLVDVDDTTTYQLGIAHRFTDYFAMAVSGTIEEGNEAPFTPLRVSGNSQSVALGGEFKLNDHVDFTTGVSYGWVEGSTISISGQELAQFDDGNFWGFTSKIGVHF